MLFGRSELADLRNAEELLEFCHDLAHVGRSVFDTFGDHLHHDLRQPRRDVLDDRFRSYDRFGPMLRDDLQCGRAGEWSLPGDQRIQRAAQRINVGSVVDCGRVFGLFGSHERRRPQRDVGESDVALGDVQQVGVRLIGVDVFGSFDLHQTEVGDLQDAIVADHHVGWFHIAVNHAVAVRGLQTSRGLQHVADGNFDIQFAGFFDDIRQRSPFDELHREKVCVVVAAKIKDLHDVVVRDLSRGVGLAREPSDHARFASPLSENGLERNFAIERDLSSSVDSTHRPATKFVKDPIASETLRD